MGYIAVESSLIISLICLLGTKVLNRNLERKNKLDIRRKSVPEILMWNSSVNNINNPINLGLIDAIVEHETVRDHLGNKRS